jgi:hypothetical protein
VNLCCCARKFSLPLKASQAVAEKHQIGEADLLVETKDGYHERKKNERDEAKKARRG